MKKACKLISLVLVLVMLLSMTVTMASAATYKYVKTSTSGSYVNLRKSASTSASSLGKVYDGAKVEYLGKSGDWSKVKATISGKAKTGYIMTTYLTDASGSGSSGGSSGVISAAGEGTVSKKTYLYKSSSTSSTKLKTLSVGASVTVTQVGTNWVKATYSGATGYIPRKYVNGAGSSSGGNNAAGPSTSVNLSNDIKAGTYTTSDITAPPSTVSTKEGYWNAINYNLKSFPSSFSVNVTGGDPSWNPASIRSLEYNYLTNIQPSAYPSAGAVTFSATYNDAGKVIANYKYNKSLGNDAKTTALKGKVDTLMSNVSGKTDYEKIVYLHDYLVSNISYTDGATTAYNALVEKKANCQGYAEAMGVLLSCAGFENRIVWANSNMNDGTKTHVFNKVLLDGKWYNVDVTVDDPNPDDSSRQKRGFLLVTDAVSAQRYAWDTKRYPASNTANNWHHRNNQVATSQSELSSIVKKAVSAGKSFVTVWVDDYSTSKYSPAKISGVKNFSIIKASNTYSTFATEIYMYLK